MHSIDLYPMDKIRYDLSLRIVGDKQVPTLARDSPAEQSRKQSGAAHSRRNPQPKTAIVGLLLLMAEILHHLGCMKPYK